MLFCCVRYDYNHLGMLFIGKCSLFKIFKKMRRNKRVIKEVWFMSLSHVVTLLSLNCPFIVPLLSRMVHSVVIPSNDQWQWSIVAYTSRQWKYCFLVKDVCVSHYPMSLTCCYPLSSCVVCDVLYLCIRMLVYFI